MLLRIKTVSKDVTDVKNEPANRIDPLTGYPYSIQSDITLPEFKKEKETEMERLGFAKGGAVRKGQPTIVGEQGAELFIPNQTGQITQAARGTNGGQTTVNFNINTLDASGFDELLIRNRGTITSIINSAVNERGSKNLI